jgi:hypothetical protein
MSRAIFALASATIILTAVGCNMCSHPYDHSGPVYSQDGCGSSHGRAGSILDGSSSPSPSMVKTQIPDESVAPESARQKTRKSAEQSVSSEMLDDQAQTKTPRTRSRTAASRVTPNTRTQANASRMTAQAPATPDSIDERVPGRIFGQTQPGDVPGSEKVVSVTERIVNPSADSSTAASEPSTEPSKPLPASGWTARRPTTDVMR